ATGICAACDRIAPAAATFLHGISLFLRLCSKGGCGMRHARGRTLSVVLSALAIGAVLAAPGGVASAKTPGKTYCINGVCHRVKTIAEMETLVGHEEVVVASYYDDCKVDKHNPCTALSSGEEFRPDLPDNAASPVYPNGTIL